MADARSELSKFLASGARLACPPVTGDIEVSVIVVIWNQPHFVLRCLRALVAQAGPSTEIILVDNASSMGTQKLLSRLDGFRILRNPVNEGFLRACNRGAEAASGRALLLLNSDAFVREKALANALATLESDPSIGAVGGRLVLPSGKLQEAGCIVWSDATTSGYGRGLEPDASDVMRRRDVDYCSAAFLMTSRLAWRRLGGFDEVYAPGYYEETDYCLRLWAAGLRVVFEPGVIVDHYEFGSEAKAGDAARMSERNLTIFRDRHADVLRDRHLARSEPNLAAAHERVPAVAAGPAG